MPSLLRIVLAATVSSVLYLAAGLFPPAATPLALLVPLPGLILAARRSETDCAVWLLLIAAAAAIALGIDAALGFALPFGLPTFVMAIGIRSAWSFERTVVAGVAAASVGMFGIALLAAGDLSVVVDSARQQVTNSVDMLVATYGSIGTPDGSLGAMLGEPGAVVSGLLEILPALIVLATAAVVIANLLLLRNWTDPSDRVDLRLWKAPAGLIWVLIVSGFGTLVPSPALAAIARNLLIIVLGCYFCQGLAIVSYYLERFRLPRGVRIVGYVLIAVQHVAAAIVLALGVFDLWGNFRRLNASPADVPFHSDGD